MPIQHCNDDAPLTRNAGGAMGRTFRMLLLGFSTVLGLIAEPAPSPDLSPMIWARWPGYSRPVPTAVACEGNLAVVAAGPGDLHVIDLTDPRNPVRRSGVAGTGLTNTWIQLAGGVAYAGVTNRGIQVFDVRDPDHPVLRGFYDATACSDLALGPGFALVANGTNGLETVDFADLDHPVKVAATATGGAAVRVLIHEGIAYVSDSAAGLELFDLSSPEHPVLRSTLGIQQTKSAYWMNFLGSDLVVVGLSQFGGTYGEVLDVSDVFHPMRISGRAFPYSSTESPAQFASFDQLLFRAGIGSAGGFTLELYQDMELKGIRGLQAPNRVSVPSRVTGMARTGSLLCLIDETGGLRTMDLTDPTQPVLLSELRLLGEGLGVALEGNRLYVADGWAGLQLLDVSDPAKPLFLGQYFNGNQILQVIPAEDGTVFVRDSSGTIERLDVTDPSKPHLVGHLGNLGLAASLVYRSGYLYSGGSGGWGVFDWRNPAQPGNETVSSFAAQLSGLGQYAEGRGSTGYLFDNTGQIVEFDFSVPGHPAEMGAINVGIRYVQRMAVHGETSVIGANSLGGNSLQIRVGPDAPLGSVVSNYLPMIESLNAIQVTDAAVYLAGQQGVAYEYDNSRRQHCLEILSNPEKGPVRRIGAYTFREGLQTGPAIEVAEPFLYAANAEGVTVVKVDHPAGLLRAGSLGGVTNLPPELEVAALHEVSVAEVHYRVGPSGYISSYTNAPDGSPILWRAFPEFGEYFYWFAAVGNWIVATTYYDQQAVVLDVSVPGKLIQVVPTVPMGRALAVGRRLFITRYDLPGHLSPEEPGLRIYDLVKGAQLPLVGTALHGIACGGLDFADPVLWVAAGARGLLGVDVSDAAHPVLVGSVPSYGFATNVVILGHHAYVAERSGGLTAVDVSDPRHPQIVARNTSVYGTSLWKYHGQILFQDDSDRSLVLFNPVDDSAGGVDLKLSRAGRMSPIGVDLRGPPGTVGRLQRADQLGEWTEWRSVQMGPAGVHLDDPDAISRPAGFYRFVRP